MMVFITGMGAISATGIGVDAYEEAIFGGHSALAMQEHLQGPSRQAPIGAFAPTPSCPAFVDHEVFKSADRALRMALVAIDEALSSSGITIENLRSRPLALILGTSLGNMLTAMTVHRRNLSGEFVDVSQEARIPLNALTEEIALILGVSGMNLTISNACVSGVNSVGMAFDYLRDKDFDRALCVGVDSFHTFTFTGFASLWALSDEKIQAFGAGRKGTLLGEAAAAVILESADLLKEQGKPALAEVLGYGLAGDGVHITAPARDGGGAARSMKRALADSGLSPEDIVGINANATGSGYGDASEVAALHSVFGEGASSIPISSVKPVTGHTLGAAGVLETIASVLSLRRKELPPNVGTEEIDPACKVDAIMGEPRAIKSGAILSHGSGFGGANASLIFRLWEGA